MKKFDVVIVGGGTAGCACAYTAAKLGMKVLLIEKNSFLGGSLTSSLVMPAMKTSDNSINNDFFNKLYTELENFNGAITYSDGNKGWFNPELCKIALDSMITDVGVEVLLCTKVKNIDKKLSSYILTIHSDNSTLLENELSLHIETTYLVDATGDAKICQILNCDFLENNKKNQPISLRFIMSGVNNEKFINWLMKFDTDRDVTTSCVYKSKSYCSTAYTWDKSHKWALKPLFEQAIAENVITEEDSNYFQLFSVAGAPDSIAFNAPRLINPDLTETEAYMLGRQSILRLSRFCIKFLPGFDNAYISSIANSLGIRVSNRVKCKYIYTKDDLITGKKFENPVVISNYPIDIHSDKKDSSTLEKVMKEYQLPVESLIVSDNLYVIGRCFSADFEAQAALRIIPSCFSMGEGLAKYLAKK